MKNTDPFEAALAARKDLEIYKHNAHLLYALELYVGADDIHSIATEALTDGAQDKKCDLIYINKDSGELIIAQGYVATPRRDKAKGNKADDLNTAVSWALQVPIENLPELLRDAAVGAREAIKSGAITKLHIWYVHNCEEHQDIQSCLDGVKHTASAIINSPEYSECEINEVTAIEVGRNRLNSWYKAQEVSILVNEEFEVTIPGGYELKNGDDWSSYVTSVPGSWIKKLFSDYGSDLFSANVRGYLGSRNSDKNINNNIKRSAQNLPSDFWVFNNGITALVHSYEPNGNKLKLNGISIVNGAQTTGSIGSINTDISEEILIPSRFVACTNLDTIEKIIKFNNSQNQVKATDFRSGDVIQQRLRSEFESILDTDYSGGRRGGDDDVIRRQPNSIPAGAASQALAAFHQNPVEAYNGKSKLWESDTLYASIFNDRTTAGHLIFCYSLVRAVDKYKAELSILASSENIQEADKRTLLFFKKRGAPYLFVAAMAKCIESILNKAIPDKFSLSFDKLSLEQSIQAWEPVIKFSVGFINPLDTYLSEGLASNESTVQPINAFSSSLHGVMQVPQMRTSINDFISVVHS